MCAPMQMAEASLLAPFLYVEMVAQVGYVNLNLNLESITVTLSATSHLNLTLNLHRT